MTHLRSTLPLATALAVATGIAAAADSTPLGKWMKQNMGLAKAGQDFDALQKNYEFVAAHPPPSGGYPQWAALATKGAADSAKKNNAAFKADCDSCHDAYRAKYRKEFPTRPFP
jgi:hypothetical protein